MLKPTKGCTWPCSAGPDARLALQVPPALAVVVVVMLLAVMQRDLGPTPREGSAAPCSRSLGVPWLSYSCL